MRNLKTHKKLKSTIHHSTAVSETEKQNAYN